MTHPLDNPIWASLHSRHRALAQRQGAVVRYPADIAPFLGVEGEGVESGAALDALVAPGDSVYLLGPVPAAPPGWRLEGPVALAQMVCDAPIDEPAGPPIIELGERDHAAVLDLTARVYPHYFRPRTMALGRYFGIFEGERLAAIIGERMGTDGWQEISAVCTEPDCNGRGYARRLLAWLSNDTLARGRTPFLHVSPDNTRAKALYDRIGYRDRRSIPFWTLRRATAV